jgi:hypothetical protein
MTDNGTYWVFRRISNESRPVESSNLKTEGNFHSRRSGLRREGAAALFAETPHYARIARYDPYAER